MRKKFPLVLLVLFTLFPLAGQITNNIDIRTALLEQSQAQQESHMAEEDRRLEQNRKEIEEIKSELAQIRGFGLAIGSILGLLQLVPILLNLRTKRS